MLIDFEDHPGVFMSHDLCASLDVGSRPDGVGCVGVAQIIWPDRGCNVYRTGDNAWSYKDTVFDSARVVRTAEETRPLNRAVRYLIRAR